jgi:DNA invertase Pin-like site-specific DNA recombinase
MAQGKFVAYYRVSTQQQGASGLGLEAQREAVRRYLNGGEWSLVGEFTEIESGSKFDRPQLAAAQADCKRKGATLIVAKLDRLARDVRRLLELVDEGVPVRFVDFPEIPEGAVGRLVLTQIASVAEFERRRISERTKAALAAAKARGVKLGVTGPANLKANLEQRKAAADQYARKVRSVLLGLKARGLSQRAIAAELNSLGIAPPRGGEWHLATVQRVMARLRPEQRVIDLAAELREQGLDARAIVAELVKRGLFDAEGKPFTTATVAELLAA